MFTQWKTQVRDLVSARYSLLGLKGQKAEATKALKEQASKQPYQNPGKDKIHPGDDAAVRASTEHQEVQPAHR